MNSVPLDLSSGNLGLEVVLSPTAVYSPGNGKGKNILTKAAVYIQSSGTNSP